MVAKRVRQAIEFAKKARSFLLRDMWAVDTTGKRRVISWAVHLLKLSFLVYKNLSEKRFFLRAHALTYWTLISIVPLLAMLAVGLKGLGQTDMAHARFWPQVEKLLTPVAPAARMMLKDMPSKDTTGAPAGGAGPDAGERSAPKPKEGASAEGDAAAAEDAKVLVARIRGYVEGLNTKGMGVAGLTIALLTVISLLTKIEQGFNDIWGIRRKRTFVTRFVVYWGVMTLPTLMLVVAGGYNIATKGEKLVDQVHGIPVIGALTRVLLPYVWVWIAFALLYMIMPNARVRLRSAIVAGVVAGTIWHLMNQGYAFYFSWMASSGERYRLYKVLYGSLAAVPFMLFWVHLSWAVVLFGAGVAYADQNLSVFEREGVTLSMSFGDRMFVGLRCLVAIGQAFHFDRKPLEARSIYVSLRLPASIVHDCLQELKDLGYITESMADDSDSDSVAYQPASSLENYKVYEIVHKMQYHGGRHFPMPDDKAKAMLDDTVARIWDVTEKELGEVTMHDLALQAGPFSEREAASFEDEVEALLKAEEQMEEGRPEGGEAKGTVADA